MIFEQLVAAPPQPVPAVDLADWRRRHLAAGAGYDDTMDRTLAAANRADRLGYAFASGYWEALCALVPGDPEVARTLCVTELAGNRPRAIATELVDGRLTGTKRWSTMAGLADELLVAARVPGKGKGRARPELVLARVPAARAGITIEQLAPLGCAPELSHSVVQFQEVSVSVEELLPGDGYDRYVKPFRTVEDCHVHAAVAAYLLSVARRCDWPQDVCERLLVIVAALRAVGKAAPSGHGTHIALGASLDQLERVLAELGPHWMQVDAGERQRWLRDQPLLQVAERARASRRELAWQRALFPTPGPPTP